MRKLGVFGVLSLLFGAAHAQAPKTETPKAPDRTARPVALAVIVHPKNPVKQISLRGLRAYLKMDRHMWPNKKRCVIYLPSRKTEVSQILLKRVYRMTRKQLKVYWARKLFSGEIPAKPSYVPSAAAAGSQVRRSEGAISIVASTQVPRNVRVLLVDGKKPGDAGYPLVGEAKP